MPLNTETITAVAPGISLSASAGTGNTVLATGENAAAISSAVLSFVIPLIVASVLIVIFL